MRPNTLPPKYKILPDEVEPKKFRVVYSGNEYTVSYKKRLLHGLTKYMASKMAEELERKRVDAINRLAKAITEFNKLNPKPNEQAMIIRRLSVRHRIGVKSIQAAILMQAGGLN